VPCTIFPQDKYTVPSGHDFNGVRSTSRAAYAEDGGNWKNPWEKTKKKRECFHFAVDFFSEENWPENGLYKFSTTF